MSVIYAILISVPIYIVGSLIWFFQVRKFYLTKNRIPGPTPIPILGNLSVAIRGNFKMLNIMAHVRKYGDIMRYFMGPYAVVVLENPEYVQILTNSPHILDRSPHAKVMDQLIGEGSVLTSSGEKWKKVRPAMNQSFLTIPPADSFAAMRKTCDQLLREMEEKSENGMFPIFPVFLRFNLVALTRITISKDQEDYSFLFKFNDFEQMLETVVLRLFSPLHYFDLTFQYTKAGKHYNSIKKILHDQMSSFLNTAISERNETIKEGREVPNRFALNIIKNCPNDTFDNLKTHLLGMYGAGVDTTANALTFAVIMLALNEDCQTRLHEEIVRMDEELEGREMELNDLPRFEYLGLVVKETLRLFPIAPTIGRYTTEDVQFGKYTVPKHTEIMINLINYHRNEKYFPNPLKFDPERFALENADKIRPYTYLPFSLGKRACLGIKYAQMAMKIVLIEVVRNFKIYSEYKDFEEMNRNLQGSITLNDKNEGRVRLVKRT